MPRNLDVPGGSFALLGGGDAGGAALGAVAPLEAEEAGAMLTETDPSDYPAVPPSQPRGSQSVPDPWTRSDPWSKNKRLRDEEGRPRDMSPAPSRAAASTSAGTPEISIATPEPPSANSSVEDILSDLRNELFGAVSKGMCSLSARVDEKLKKMDATVEANKRDTQEELDAVKERLSFLEGERRSHMETVSDMQVRMRELEDTQ